MKNGEVIVFDPRGELQKLVDEIKKLKEKPTDEVKH